MMDSSIKELFKEEGDSELENLYWRIMSPSFDDCTDKEKAEMINKLLRLSNARRK